MTRKTLYALGLLLCLSTVATSNECLRYHHRAAGKDGCTSQPSSSTSKSPAAASSSIESTASEAHILLHTFIKLLYI